MKKLLASLMLIVASVVGAQTINTLDPTQVYNTGNIVNNTTNPNTITSTWQNVGVMNQGLPCWSPGDPGCGPQPYFNQGSFNFSYGVTDVYQIANIANALPNSGTGLRVNGYNFGFTAKNGNGWDGGGLDTLSAYVTFYGSDGKPVRYDYYDLNFKFDWNTFNYSKTFDTPYASKDLSNVRYGFIGGDTSNYWAGPYGPEIYNINFSINYSVDPCATNPLYSPTCPGYNDALAKLIPTSTTTVDPVSVTSTSPLSTTTIVTDPVLATVNVTSTSTVGQPVTTIQPTSSTASTSNSTNITSQSTKETASGSTNTSLALSIISKNSERDAAGAAVAQSAVSQAQQAANQAQQEAANVAANAVSNSISANIVSGSSQQFSGTGIRANNSNTTGFTLQSGLTSLSITGPQSSTQAFVQQQNSNTVGTSLTNNQPVVVVNTGSQQVSNSATFILPLLQPQQPSITISNTTAIQAEQQPQTTLQNNSTPQVVETYSIITPNLLTDKSNPLTDIIEGKQNIPQNSTTATTGPTVNKNAQNNEVAGGVDINKMALAPNGYADYTNFTLRDAQFYAPKEVYRNQKNVDNARALRQLTNDSKHQEMVEQQYRR